MSNYPIGARVTYADANATVSDGAPGINSGVVNGPPIEDDDGNVIFVPVYSSRDKGREDTTVYVAVSNLVS